MSIINETTKRASAWLSYVAYTDPNHDGDPQQTTDIQNNLKSWIKNDHNGPYTLVWGPATAATSDGGILIYGAYDRNRNLTIACRGTIGWSIWNILNFLSNLRDDLDGLFTEPWPYQKTPGDKAFVTAGMMDAFHAIKRQEGQDHLAGGKVSLETFIQRHNKPGENIIVTGHSLGAALANILAVYLANRFESSKTNPRLVTMTFAAPTVTNDIFQNKVFSHYIKESWQSVNEHDNIPRAWQNILGIAFSYIPEGTYIPPLYQQDSLLFDIISGAGVFVDAAGYNFTPVTGRSKFQGSITYNLSWIYQTWTQHMLGGSYFSNLGLTPPTTGNTASVPSAEIGDIVVPPLKEKVIKSKGAPTLKLSLVEQ